MGQKRRQLREELERREKGVAGGGRSPANGSGGLGTGGEARLVAELKKQGEEMRKQQGRERERKNREQKAAMELERARKRSSPTAAGEHNDDDLEERTVRVKWSTKKESHSDHTLDVLFSKFGTVESVSIEAGSGNKALVTFASSTAADNAVAAYNEDHETMRASIGKKKRARRSSFVPRREKTTPLAARSPGLSPGGDAAEGMSSPASLRDKESVVMMKLRQEAERQAIIRQMAADEGISLEQAGGKPLSSPVAAAAAVASPVPTMTRKDRASSSNGVAEGETVGTQQETNGTREGGGGRATGAVGEGVYVDDVDGSSTMRVGDVGLGGVRQHSEWPYSPPPAAGKASSTPSCSFTSPSFLSPMRSSAAAVQRRESDILSAMTRGAAGSNPCTPGSGVDGTSGFGEGDMPTPVIVCAGKRSSGGKSPVDEGAILARMMRFK